LRPEFVGGNESVRKWHLPYFSAPVFVGACIRIYNIAEQDNNNAQDKPFALLLF
jgi:hypothetical protein